MGNVEIKSPIGIHYTKIPSHNAVMLGRKAELAPFKDWAKSSSSSSLDHPHNAADDDDGDFTQSLNGANSAYRRAREGLKKRKIIRI